MKCLRALKCAWLMFWCWGMQAYIGFRSSIWSFNQVVAAWEPVMEPWDIILKMDANPSPLVSAVPHPWTDNSLMGIQCSSWLLHISIATVASIHGMTVHKHMRCCRGPTASAVYLQIVLPPGCIWGPAWHPSDGEEHERGAAPDPGLCRCQLCGCSHPGVEGPAWRSGQPYSSCAWPAHLTNQACDSMSRLGS